MFLFPHILSSICSLGELFALVRVIYQIKQSCREGRGAHLVIWQASDGDEVLDLARTQPADIVLMDVQMARVNGIAATERLLPEFPDTQVIMLTTFDDQNFVHGAISAAASLLT